MIFSSFGTIFPPNCLIYWMKFYPFWTFLVFIKANLHKIPIFLTFNFNNQRKSQLCSSFPFQSRLNSLNLPLSTSIFVKWEHYFIKLFSNLIIYYRNRICSYETRSFWKTLFHRKSNSRLNSNVCYWCIGSLIKACRFGIFLQLILSYCVMNFLLAPESYPELILSIILQKRSSSTFHWTIYGHISCSFLAHIDWNNFLF